MSWHIKKFDSNWIECRGCKASFYTGKKIRRKNKCPKCKLDNYGMLPKRAKEEPVYPTYKEIAAWCNAWWEDDEWRKEQLKVYAPDVAQLLRGIANMIEGENLCCLCGLPDPDHRADWLDGHAHKDCDREAQKEELKRLHECDQRS